MIISTLGEFEEEEDSYPYIGKHRDSNVVVMFTDVGEGVVMYAVDAENYVGRPIKNLNEDKFEVYNGPVTVRNSILGRP